MNVIEIPVDIGFSALVILGYDMDAMWLVYTLRNTYCVILDFWSILAAASYNNMAKLWWSA